MLGRILLPVSTILTFLLKSVAQNYGVVAGQLDIVGLFIQKELKGALDYLGQYDLNVSIGGKLFYRFLIA
ncbi:hypothetical protein AMS62_26360 [Bacillus sp. FJAT-18019]|nr:hypothetical protein AMS62_26360 [Bacillus sp. FJAT-18019]